MKPLQSHQQTKGKIIFIGAGCGDPELLTIKGLKHLQTADVVLTDRLVSPQIISEYVNPQTEVVYAGKNCRKGGSTLQETINELLVIYAGEGKKVVRLKGGDVSVFSNIYDELETLVQKNIPYEIVPGITAAIGAAAYAGIPLTARGICTGVRFLTAYTKSIVPYAHWKELAHTTDTLVFYMSAETTDWVVRKLYNHGLSSTKKIAVVEQATTPSQQIHIYSFEEFLALNERASFVSPSLIIIGEVVSLHEDFAWFTSENNNQEYFNLQQQIARHPFLSA